jgi:hypothetical protein
MDEEDGRPGACSRQFGHANAPAGAVLQALFQHCRARFFGSAAQAIPQGPKPNADNAGLIGTTEVVPLRVHPSGAEALFDVAGLRASSARLKSRPFTNPASPLRGFAAISHPYPTLKRGANNRCAYGALGTAKVVPFHVHFFWAEALANFAAVAARLKSCPFTSCDPDNVWVLRSCPFTT